MISRIITKCGAIIEAILTEFEKTYGLTWCPLTCSNCGNQHGWETFKEAEG